jgi:hypothetical protein
MAHFPEVHASFSSKVILDAGAWADGSGLDRHGELDFGQRRRAKDDSKFAQLLPWKKLTQLDCQRRHLTEAARMEDKSVAAPAALADPTFLGQELW